MGLILFGFIAGILLTGFVIGYVYRSGEVKRLRAALFLSEQEVNTVKGKMWVVGSALRQAATKDTAIVADDIHKIIRLL